MTSTMTAEMTHRWQTDAKWNRSIYSVNTTVSQIYLINQFIYICVIRRFVDYRLLIPTAYRRNRD